MVVASCYNGRVDFVLLASLGDDSHVDSNVIKEEQMKIIAILMVLFFVGCVHTPHPYKTESHEEAAVGIRPVKSLVDQPQDFETWTFVKSFDCPDGAMDTHIILKSGRMRVEVIAYTSSVAESIGEDYYPVVILNEQAYHLIRYEYKVGRVKHVIKWHPTRTWHQRLP